jgi:hypothetical protein
VVDGAQIERAERILQVTYQEESVPRQLLLHEVVMEDFTNWLDHRKGSAFKHYYQAYKGMDPRIEQAFNTLLMHFFLVGLVCGRDERVGIE